MTDVRIIKRLNQNITKLSMRLSCIYLTNAINLKKTTEGGITIGNLGQELKYDEDKPRLDLVPPDAIIAIGTIMTYGLNKYFEGGWKKVEAWRYRAAMMRHMMEYLREPTSIDEESGYTHLWHIITNAAFLCELEEGNHERDKV